MPTPHGDIAARWERTDETVTATLTVPAGTSATFGCRLSSDVTADGAPYAGGALGPGCHAIAVRGVTADSFADAALWGGIRSDGEDWRVLPGMDGTPDANPNATFELVSDLGTVCELQAVEVTAGTAGSFPSEIGVDVSTDGRSFVSVAERTGAAYPGQGKQLALDLHTVSGELKGRYLRFRFRRPPAWTGESGTWYNVRIPKIRVRVGR